MVALAARNPRVQQLRRLVRQRKARDEAGLFVLEGAGLVAEALAAGAPPAEVFLAADGDIDRELARALAHAGVTIFELDGDVISSIASTTTPQPIIATVPYLDVPLDDIGDVDFALVLAGVREPGNAGTLIRTAAASGAGVVVMCDDPVDLYNPKAVRASAGAVFRVPVVRNAPVDDVATFSRINNMRVLGLLGAGDTVYDTLDLTEPVAIVVGNEAHGVSSEVEAIIDAAVTIPMAAGVESINVAAAAAAVAFEVARQRRHRTQ